MLEPRGNRAEPWRTAEEVAPRTIRLLETSYEDRFWGDLAERLNFARQVRDGVFRFPSREGRRFWNDLKMTYFTDSRPRGA